MLKLVTDAKYRKEIVAGNLGGLFSQGTSDVCEVAHIADKIIS